MKFQPEHLSMDANGSTGTQLQAEIEVLRSEFPDTQDLYREACVLLFFRHGITPTANKLYQLVRKGSMSAPAEALGKFWADLREKSRGRVEHPDLPEDLKTAAGELVSTLWTKAQGLAQESLAALRAEAQAAVLEAKAGKAEAEAARDAARQEFRETSAELVVYRARGRELEQALAGELATRLALQGQLGSAQQAAIEQQKAMDEARRDFASELEKVREALKATEERYQAAESRALLEIDRERTIAARLQKDFEIARASALEAADRHRAEVSTLQDEIGNQKGRIGHLEGELGAVSVSRDQLLTDLNQERGSIRELSTRLASVAHEAEVWQQKANEAHREIEALRTARPRKNRRGPETKGSLK